LRYSLLSIVCGGGAGNAVLTPQGKHAFGDLLEGLIAIWRYEIYEDNWP